MAPDGSGFEVGGTYKGGSGVFLDRLGQPVPGQAPPGDDAGAMWADDNQHQCLLTFDRALVWKLMTDLPGQAAQPVAVIARDRSVGQTGLSVAVCSFQNDRAIVTRTVISSISEVCVVKLSDGKLLSHHSFGADPAANLVASRDAAYVAETPGIGADVAWRAAGARILRVSDWTLVGTALVANVWGFSGDDSLLLADQLQPNPVAPIEVVDWRSGLVLRRAEVPATLGGFVAQPGGRAFALV